MHAPVEVAPVVALLAEVAPALVSDPVAALLVAPSSYENLSSLPLFNKSNFGYVASRFCNNLYSYLYIFLHF